MKFIDRVPTNANRRKITYEDGSSEYATIEYADNPTVTGTMLNANNFNNITNDIISKINESKMSIVRDNTGAVVIDTNTIVNCGKVKYGDLNTPKTGVDIEIETSIVIQKYYNQVFGFKLGYSSATDYARLQTHPHIYINGTEYVLTASSISSNVDCMVKDISISDYFSLQASNSSLKNFDIGETVNLKYVLHFYGDISGQYINGLYIIPIYFPEKRIVLKGV